MEQHMRSKLWAAAWIVDAHVLWTACCMLTFFWRKGPRVRLRRIAQCVHTVLCVHLVWERRQQLLGWRAEI